MNSKKLPDTQTVAQPTQHFRTFMLKIVLLWMLLVVAFWMFTKHLPSQFVFTEKSQKALPAFLAALGTEKLKTFATLAEIIFSLTLIILLFLPASRRWLYIHIAAILFFGVVMFVIRGSVVIPLTAYALLIISFLFYKSENFTAAFDFLLTLIVVLSLVFAAEYFVRWQTSFKTPSYVLFLKVNMPKFSTRDKILYQVMPWFYAAFVVLLIRIFTTKLNTVLFIICLLLLTAEFYLNSFFDAGLTFMLFPFVNWQNVYYKFNKRFEPK